MLKTQEKRHIRHKRVRAKISGTGARPRLYVFRSSAHIYGQLIDDEKAKTLISASDLELKNQKIKSKNKEGIELSGKTALAFEVGKLLGQKALEKKIEKIVFDRAGYRYHGRVKALAEGAREVGLKF